MAGQVPVITQMRGGRLISSAIFKGRSFSIGKNWKCDLADPYSDTNRQILLKRTASNYTLFLPPNADGTFTRSGSTLSMDEMLSWGFARKTSAGTTIPFNLSMTADVTIGVTAYSIVFSESARSVAKAVPATSGKLPLRYRLSPPERSDISFTVILFLLLTIQVLGVQSLRDYPIPEITTLKQLPRRISRLILEPVAPPAPTRLSKQDVGTAPAEKSPEPPGAEKQPVAEPETVPTPQVAKTAAPGRTRETIRRQVSKVGVLGILTGKGTAGRSTARSGISALQLGRDLEKSLDDILSEISGITTITGAFAGTADEGGAGGTGPGTDLLDIQGKLDESSVSEPIKVSSLGRVPTGTGPVDEKHLEEVVRPEERDERSTRAIARVVAAHTGAIRYAYNRELRKNPALRGKIVLTFTISPQGAVIECHIEESAMNWPPLEESLVRMVSAWEFPPIPEGAVTVSYPLVFFPSM